MKANTMLLALSVSVAPLAVVAQDADPFKKAKGASEKGPATIDHQSVNIEVCYESFSLPLAEAASLSREALPDSELYERVLRMIDEGKAQQERFTVIRIPDGQKATSKSVTETIYAGEYEPPEMPNTVGVQLAHPDGPDVGPGVIDANTTRELLGKEALDALRTPATPTAYNTRDTGHSLEVEGHLNLSAKSISLTLVPESIVLTGNKVQGQGLSETQMPEFELQRLKVQATVFHGVPHLLGTVSRPPASEVDPDAATTTWFAFVTARPVSPK